MKLSVDDLLWQLPLFNDVYYSMQGQNVMMVDVYLRDLENSSLEECYAVERTPMQSVMFLSAISQMWIFATYELLRTWRQAVRELNREDRDDEFLKNVDTAKSRVEPVFRQIEALRMNLAKHEVKGKGTKTMEPGYARIDESTGSLQWLVDLTIVVFQQD